MLCAGEHRLTQVVSGTLTASYVYDGDGNRVKAVVNGTTTVYIGNYFEWVSASVTRTYYYVGATRVAERVGGTVYYLFGDHLGSTSVSYQAGTGSTVTQRYDPWVAVRGAPGNALPTDYTFTGQRLDGGTTLLDYQARWYDPALGRFYAADTIVSQPGNPQGLNRYSYALNSPLRYTDPTGHRECESAEDCRDMGTTPMGTGGPKLPPPQPPGTPWDTPLDFWIEPGGAYGQGVVFLQVQGVIYGPISVFVPAPKYASSAGWSAVRRYRGGLTMIKRGTGLQHMIAGYAAAHQASGSTDDPLRLVPYKIGVKQQDVFPVDGRGQPQKGYGAMSVPGQYDTGGLGAGTTAEAMGNAWAALSPGTNSAMRYVTITIEQHVIALRALVVAEYPVQAWVSWSDTATPWYLETPIPPSPYPYQIGQNWSQTTQGSH